MTITLALRRTDEYSSVWLKGIRAVDLDVHCIDTFIGQRYAKPELRRLARQATLTLNLQPGEKALYLCGVTYPYRWVDNAHLALLPREGSSWHGPALVPGLTVTVLGAEPVLGWGEHSIDPQHPRAGDRMFRTCRNWQFAHWAAEVLDVPREVNPEAHRGRRADAPTRRRRDDQTLFRNLLRPRHI